MYYSRITGWGKYTPERILTNQELEQMVETSDEWIVQRTGIKERRIAGESDTTVTMAVKAAHKAMESAGVTANDLDLIVAATSSPDYFVPAAANLIQSELDASCPAFTMATGCTGFVYGLVTAHQYIATGAFKNVLLVGVELISRFLDWNDRNTCVLFGDGAGAVVLQPTTEPGGVLGFDLGSDGAKGMHLAMEGGGSAYPMSYQVIDEGKNYLRMNGREVFKFATRILSKSTTAALNHANVPLEDVRLIIPHQANARIIESAIKALDIEPERVFVNLHKYGNTSAASIPLALVEALDEGLIMNGDKLVMVSFGSGLTWASAVLEWNN